MKYTEYKLDCSTENDFYTPIHEIKKTRGKTKVFPDSFTRAGDGIPVFDQGWLGSCVGASGKVVVRDNCFREIDLSALWIYCRAKLYDEWKGEAYSGTSIKGACKAIWAEGCAREEVAPYSQTEPSSFSHAVAEDASGRKIGSFEQLPINDEFIDEIKSILMERGRIWTSFKVHDQFYRMSSLGLIPYEDDYLSSAYRGGHAVAMSGWRILNGRLHWEFQNSWGYRFGTNGYFYISHDLYKKICTSAYVVSSDGKAYSVPNKTFLKSILYLIRKWVIGVKDLVGMVVSKILSVFKK